MTINADDYWSVTVHAAKFDPKIIGPKKWKSKVSLIRRDNEERIKTPESFGTTEKSSMNNGLKLGAEEAKKMGKPKDWMTRARPEFYEI